MFLRLQLKKEKKKKITIKYLNKIFLYNNRNFLSKFKSLKKKINFNKWTRSAVFLISSLGVTSVCYVYAPFIYTPFSGGFGSNLVHFWELPLDDTSININCGVVESKYGFDEDGKIVNNFDPLNYINIIMELLESLNSVFLSRINSDDIDSLDCFDSYINNPGTNKNLKFSFQELEFLLPKQDIQENRPVSSVKFNEFKHLRPGTTEIIIASTIILLSILLSR